MQRLSLLQHRPFPVLLIDVRHQAFADELGTIRGQLLQAADALALRRHLQVDEAALGFEPLDLSGQALPLGCRALHLGGNLAGEGLPSAAPGC